MLAMEITSFLSGSRVTAFGGTGAGVGADTLSLQAASAKASRTRNGKRIGARKIAEAGPADKQTRPALPAPAVLAPATKGGLGLRLSAVTRELGYEMRFRGPLPSAARVPAGPARRFLSLPSTARACSPRRRAPAACRRHCARALPDARAGSRAGRSCRTRAGTRAPPPG